MKQLEWVNGILLVLFIGMGIIFYFSSIKSIRHRNNDSRFIHYRNARWGFCLKYPVTWKSIISRDNSGITLYPPSQVTMHYKISRIEIGGLPDQPQDIDNPAKVGGISSPLTLQQNFARSLKALREYGRAWRIRILKKQSMQFHGYPALATTIKYLIAPGPTQRIEKRLWVNKDNIIFTATLYTTPVKFRQILFVYNVLITHGFRLNCRRNLYLSSANHHI